MSTITPLKINLRQATNVSLPIALAIGVGIVLTIYLLAWGLTQHIQIFPLYAYLNHRGWIPPVIVFAFGLAVGVLMLKLFRIRRENKAFSIADSKVFAQAEAVLETYNAENARELFNRIRLLPDRQQDLLLLNRLKQFTFRIRNAKSTTDVDTLVSALSETDANIIQSSYATVRLLVALIPVLGFLGTVYGIGASIGQFTTVLEGATSFEMIKPALGQATLGLGIAFDTTLIALIFSSMLLIFSAVVQKMEEDLLSTIDDYCVSRLVTRVHIPSATDQLERAINRLSPDLRSALSQQTDTLCETIRESGATTTSPTDNLELDNRLQTAERELRRTRLAVEQASALVSKKLDELATNLVQMPSASPNNQHEIAVELDRLQRLLALAHQLTPGSNLPTRDEIDALFCSKQSSGETTS